MTHALKKYPGVGMATGIQNTANFSRKQFEEVSFSVCFT